MKINTYFKTGLFAALFLALTACSHMGGGMADEDSLTAQGLGKLGGFGQGKGELYTTNAPHNQVYLFPYDSSYFATKYVPSLNAQIAYLRAHPHARVLLAGHTDERGSREYNVALGERRANSVADMLRSEGINRNQYRVVSYGKERPANIGHDAEAHAQNRRVEFIYEATR